MTTVTVDKFVSGKHDATFSFPVFFLGMASFLLPQSALNALRDQGIDVPGMLLAGKQGVPYAASVNLVEHGVCKTVVVSVR